MRSGAGDEKLDPYDASNHVESAVYVAAIALVGLAYRATFITQGFNATDEGWLQSVGRRITLGQVPYRDFRFAFPPVSIYKEAALQAIFGDAYTLLFARWVFVAEATLGSVIAYLILTRFVRPRIAVLATLPTVFFSVLIYYFSNYTYHADTLALVSILLIALARKTASGRHSRLGQLPAWRPWPSRTTPVSSS
jgi:hypothetical protein